MRPDDKDWERDFGYSRAVAGVLVQSYESISRGTGTTGGFLQAGRLVAPILKARMSRRQRLHLYFLISSVYGADNQYLVALDWTDRAIMLALRLRDSSAQMELLSQRATLNRALLRFRDAITDVGDCLALLDEHRDAAGVDDPAFRLDLLSRLASFHFVLTLFDDAERVIAEARALTPLVPDGQFASANTEWIQAHIYRIKGMPELALRHALAVHEVFVREANKVTLDRLKFFIAETAMDWVDRLSLDADRKAFMMLARTHLQGAGRLAKETRDRPGQGLVRLAQIRYSRLSGATLDRITAIESVMKQARKLDDEALLAQALTALGDELAAQGNTEASLESYRNALAVLDGTQTPVLLIPAQRALRRAAQKDDGTPTS